MKMLFTRSLDSDSVEKAAWFLVWFSLPASLKLTSISLILTSVIILVSWFRHPFRPEKHKLLYMVFPVLLFFWQARELLYVHPWLPAWKEVEKNLSLIVLPVLFLLSRIDKKNFTRAAMSGLIVSLVLCGMIILVAATVRFSKTGNPSEFLYHDLAKPLHTGAIYLSLYLLFALFKLGDPVWFDGHPKVKSSIALFLLGLLLLSASRILIGLGLPLLAWQYRDLIRRTWKMHQKIMIIAFVLIIAGTIPFVQRIKPLFNSDPGVVRSESFKGSPEPNGLTLRLIFWRFGMDILSEQHAWITGTGMSRSQELLNQKINRYGLYTGSGIGNDTGYLNYNFHNQYMETLVRNGIPGLVFLLMILFTFAFQSGDKLFAPILSIYIVAGLFLTESVLERQAGIVFFCLIYSAYFSGRNPAAEKRE